MQTGQEYIASGKIGTLGMDIMLEGRDILIVFDARDVDSLIYQTTTKWAEEYKASIEETLRTSIYSHAQVVGGFEACIKRYLETLEKHQAEPGNADLKKLHTHAKGQLVLCCTQAMEEVMMEFRQRNRRPVAKIEVTESMLSAAIEKVFGEKDVNKNAHLSKEMFKALVMFDKQSEAVIK